MIKRLVVCIGIVALCIIVPQGFAATTRPATTRAASADSLDTMLETIRAKRKLPGLVGAIVEGDEVVAIGAAGVRNLDARQPITIDDKLHIGSCTKAMTATVLARLVERKKLAWDSTVAQIFPDLAPKLDAGYQGATLEQLLQHRAGTPANGPWTALGSGSTTEQRVKLIKLILGKPPESLPGTKYSYSNVGYAVAAAMGETVTGKSWEQLIQAELFDPLGMSSAGFGSPGPRGKVEQPWGHLSAGATTQPVQGDNAAPLGPAGRVHVSIRDWAKFVSLHLRGARGEETTYLTKDTFARMHRPPAGEDYALGWSTAERPWGGGTVLSHAGSNTMWYCVVWMAPKKNFAVLSVTNLGGSDAALGCDDASSAMIRHHASPRRTPLKLPTTRPGA